MAQASPTSCPHNAPGQALVPGQQTICRQCGARIEPTSRAGQIASQQSVNAAYPGDANTSDTSWVFAQ